MPVCVSFLLLTFLIAPLVAGTPSESAFKKLRSLAGKWEGKDAHGRAAKTSFEVLASGAAVMEKLEASGIEEMVTLYSIVRCAIFHWIAQQALFILLQHRIALLKEKFATAGFVASFSRSDATAPRRPSRRLAQSFYDFGGATTSITCLSFRR